MTSQATAKLVVYATLATGGFVAAVLVGVPALGLFAAPFAAIAGYGAVRAANPSVEVSAHVDSARLAVGDTLDLRVELESDMPLTVHIEAALPPGVALRDDTPDPVRLRPGRHAELEFRLRVDRFGRCDVGTLMLRATDDYGLLIHESRVERHLVVDVYPEPESLSWLLVPARVGSATGDLVSREKGEGFEFAEVREIQPGDSTRRVNWAATSRRGVVHVNRHHPERNADVVLVLDAATNPARTAPGLLNRAAGAILTLTERHLRRRDRVGLFVYGASPTWVAPRNGRDQLYRITEALMTTDIDGADVVPSVGALYGRMIPPRALIVAFTPLYDQRTLDGLLELRGRGYDLAIIELPVNPVAAEEETTAVARVWELKRRSVRALCASAGVLIVQWQDGAPLAAAIAEAREWRRGGLRASA